MLLVSLIVDALAVALVLSLPIINAEVAFTGQNSKEFLAPQPTEHPPGNASVWRYRNLQFFEMAPATHPPGNASVWRHRNLQFFEMAPPMHPPGDTFVWRYRNLQFFEMAPATHPPGNAEVTRVENLQFFEMSATQLPSITISSFVTTDEHDSPHHAFAAGSPIRFKITIFGSGSRDIPDALVSVIVQDPFETLVLLNYTVADIQTGAQVTIRFDTQISVEATLGEYTAKVNVFTDFPSQGGEPTAGGHEELTFIVE